MLTLYGHPQTRSYRAAWALAECDADYAYVKVDPHSGDARTPEFLRLNPAGKIPVLVDDDLAIFESLAIAIYIAEKFPAAQLLPTTPAARAACFQWCSFLVTELEQPLWTITRHRSVYPAEKRIEAAAELGYWEFERPLAVLTEQLLKSPFVAGESFTIADLLATSTLAWASAVKAPLPNPRLKEYRAAMLNRPAALAAKDREAASLTTAT